MLCKIEKPRMKTVPTTTIAVPLQHNRPHIVVQHLTRRAAKAEKGVLMRLDQGLDPLVEDKLDIGRSAPAQRRHKYRQPVAAAPNDRPVDLHLFAGSGLKANNRSCRLLRPHGSHPTPSASYSRRYSPAHAAR